MRELQSFNSERIYWAVEQVEQEAGDIDDLHLDDNLFYLKSEADASLTELKTKLEDAQATAYTESVNAGMANRKLERALWLSRARTAYLEFRLFVKDSVHTTDSAEANNAERMAIKWQKVEHKCRAKAETYNANIDKTQRG